MTSPDPSIPALDPAGETPGRRSTKIIATLGPATADPAVLEAMVVAGMDVARINCSHFPVTEPGAMAAAVAAVHAAGARHDRHVAVLADLAGPKLRVQGARGRLTPTTLADGDELVLLDAQTSVPDAADAALVVRVPVPELGAHLGVGDRVLLADGVIIAEVLEVCADGVRAVVQAGGVLSENKGVHFPDSTLAGAALTPADRVALALAVEAGVDLVAVSFVRDATDIAAVRALAPATIPVIAKVERRVALEHLEAIVAAADGIMVARGDLGVELAPELVPGVQKELLTLALGQGRLTVVATEMLESMIQSSRPTRAEVSDVANAALDGAGAVMLSAETAAGAHPAGAVATMARILTQVEQDPLYSRLYARLLSRTQRAHGASAMDAGVRGWAGPLSESATATATAIGAAVLVTVTETGRTAMLLSAARPGVPIVAACHDPVVARRLALVWGVTPVVVPREPSGNAQRHAAVRAAATALGLDQGVAVVLSGPPHRPGAIDTLRVLPIPGAAVPGEPIEPS